MQCRVLTRLRVEVSGCRVKGSRVVGLRVEGAGCRVKGSLVVGLRVEGLPCGRRPREGSRTGSACSGRTWSMVHSSGLRVEA